MNQKSHIDIVDTKWTTEISRALENNFRKREKRNK